jgi:threonine/homoserine/homoserine lactone efflux protein
MLNHKAFGVGLIAIGIAIIAAYFIVLAINTTLAILIAISAAVCVVGMMLFWLGFKVVRSSQAPKEAETSDKV